MNKILIFGGLLTAYFIYTGFVYTAGTSIPQQPAAEQTPLIREGQAIYQQYNCMACHQLYGLGGYLGPELTTAYSDPGRGPGFMRAFLQAGGPRMPRFGFSEQQINALLAYLQWVDATAVTYKTPVN